MPRLPVDGKKVVEHRITLGTKERELMGSLAGSVRLISLTGNVPITEIISDPIRVLTMIEAIATLLEVFGIETPIWTPVDAKQKLAEMFQDPDGAKGFKGFWDVDLGEDWERFKAGFR